MKKAPWPNIAGLTVAALVEGYDDVLITFTDGSHIVLHPAHEYDNVVIEARAYKFFDTCVSNEDCIRVGLYTAEEYNQALESRDRQTAEAAIARDRAEWARLDKKYGSKANPFSEPK
jgi:hypothetical protein